MFRLIVLLLHVVLGLVVGTSLIASHTSNTLGAHDYKNEFDSETTDTAALLQVSLQSANKPASSERAHDGASFGLSSNKSHELKTNTVKEYVAMAPDQQKARNVLFIVVDDLRSVTSLTPEAAQMHTPHFNAFIKESLLLTNSHAQQSQCSPSRSSFLFGRRPDTMHLWSFRKRILRSFCKTCKTIPEVFKDAGYYTIGMGKVFDDQYIINGFSDPLLQDPQSWSDPRYSGENFFMGTDVPLSVNLLESWGIADESATGPLQDSEVRDFAVSRLREITARSETRPWFLAVGFRKPHLPFVCPREFYNLYDIEEIKLASNSFVPEGMPHIAWGKTDLTLYKDIQAIGYTGAINETLDPGKAKDLVRAYHACVSYADHNVGVLLNELKALGHWNTTIVALLSDHGYKLGEHSGWGKDDNFHLDTNAPMMLRVPGLTDGGVVSDALVEHVDLMATLADAAGFNLPETCPEHQSWMTSYCTEGRSFFSLASNPAAAWKNASFSQFDREFQYMGYSMSTKTKLRFTAWVDFDFDEVASTTNFSMNGDHCAFELYNHSIDPGENFNLAYQSGYDTFVQELFMQLKSGWRATNALL